jgi:uncharacterized protein YgbK (DUF1537 family)
VAAGAAVLLIDVDGPESQALAGKESWRARKPGGYLVVGSSSIECALLAEWRRIDVEACDHRRRRYDQPCARGVDALTLRMPLPASPGSPSASPHSSSVDGLEVGLKGGQVGTDRCFSAIRHGLGG